MMQISEKSFEESIESGLAGHGYSKRVPEDYDRNLCLITGDLFDFLYATQPKEWEKLKKICGPDAKSRLLKRLFDQIEQRGTLEVLRKGIKSDGCRFQLAYFHPVSGLNAELQRLYEANIFSSVRQLHYSSKTEQSLDLGLFLNGLPLFTAELKNPLTGQTVENAIKQYRFDRDPKEPLFNFCRSLAHFAVDPDLVYVASSLTGPKTRFLPFNLGRDGGAGNPPSWKGYSTAYLWEQIWARDSILNLLQHFVHIVEEEDDKGRKTGKRSRIFPRYHQLDSVRRLIQDARDRGPGKSYLIQHSAGSGKSNSIAWLAHQLSVLHNDADNRVFDSIIIITDRRILDRQLQQTVRQFQQVDGVVENIDKTSRQLKEALELGKTIVVTTLQKFPVIAQQMNALAGQSFAVIIDEAHSSQSGESTKSLKKVLAAGSLEEAEKQDAKTAEEDLEDRINAEVKSRGRLPNVSYFAFTATPKPKTMELFGNRREDGSYAPFSLYSMRQAIEENFILDVLENYTTCQTYWNLLKKIETDPHYKKDKATYLLRSFVDLHEHTVNKKVSIMIDHFAGHVMHRINGKAKAMIVTRSRLHAVRYKKEVDRYSKEKGYNFKSLVAFSGIVRDGGIDYTESNMNGGISEKQTAETFKGNEYRFLIVANKFQTGFDQPLLHTMYVDKKLGGVNAVQTLSRLNRVHPGKEETMVLDFANQAEEIQEAFQPYYDRTILTEGTDPNLLHDLENKLEDYRFYGKEDIQRFAEIYFIPVVNQDKLYSVLQSPLDRFKEATKEDQAEFKGTLRDYIRLYAFLSQILPFADPELEKLYVFARYLQRRLPPSDERLPKEIQEQIDMESYRVQRTSSGKIELAKGVGGLEPMRTKKSSFSQDEIEALSAIIEELNKRFGTDFSEEDKVFIKQLEERLAVDQSLVNSVKVNTSENARLTFDIVVNELLQKMIDSNFKFYAQITDKPDFSKMFMDWLFDRYMKSLQIQEKSQK
jgi:type I restriction enzyme R subunit